MSEDRDQLTSNKKTASQAGGGRARNLAERGSELDPPVGATLLRAIAKNHVA